MVGLLIFGPHGLRLTPIAFTVVNDDEASSVPPPNFHQHATAIVEQGATVGDGSKVWHHSHVRTGARLGEACVLGKNVFIDTMAVVGDRCKIQNNVSVFHGVTIGNDVFVGPSVTFTNDLVPRAFKDDWTLGETMVENGASIGANATIVCGITLGAYCMVAAGATVTKTVLAHQLVAGTPARHRGWVCRCGVVVSREPNPPDELSCPSCRTESVS
jgi:UDP-2-acetamido-3-amino-2,3-dideoxy-glucuronate N-acetyltransferase